MNILILSAGTRCKIVEYYRELMKGEGIVIATDCSPDAPALYAADKGEIVPRINEPDYLETILQLVSRYDIRGCFSLIDPELSLLAKEQELFRALGCTPMISPYPLVEDCLHKARTAGLFAANGLASAKSYGTLQGFDEDLKAGRIGFPVFVKPEDGSASMDIRRVDDYETLSGLTARDPNLMIQEYMDCSEYGADCSIDMISGRLVSVFLKKKLRMRAGETDKSVSVADEELFRRIAEFTEKAGFRGQIDIDLFFRDGEWIFSEINPRYGGGYPHAWACGVDMPSLYLNNLKGVTNEVRLGGYPEGVVMMKYSELATRRLDDAEFAALKDN